MNEMWAKTKPYKTLLHHMIDSGLMAKRIMENSVITPILVRLKALLPGTDALNTVAFMVAIHDIGKCHPFFQGKEPSLEFVRQLYTERRLSIHQNHEYRHEIGGKHIVERILREQGLMSKPLDMLSCVLGLHHQKGTQASRNIRVPENMDRPYWEEQQKKLFQKLYELFQPNLEVFANCSDLDATAVLLWGLMILSDWLASSQDEFFNIDERLPLEEYIEASSNAVECAITSSHLQIKGCLPAKSFCDVWRSIDPENLRPLQKSCELLAESWQKDRRFDGFVLLEAPMGEGKTEAGLFLTAHLMKAFSKTGFYIALPTAATSNGMYMRILKLLEEHNVREAKLMHSQAWMLEGPAEFGGETEDAEVAAAWLAPLRRGMLSQYAVGTIDQVMMAVMRIKYGVLRLTGATSKVIVIDEVHAYDAYMLAVIERLLEWCAALSIPVVMLSATLPVERRNRLLSAYTGKQAVSISQAYPLITTASSSGLIKEIPVDGTYMHQEIKLEVRPILDEWEKVAQLAISRVSDGGCLCVLVNTVHDAQKLFQILKTMAPKETSLFLFHARFPAKKRQEIEEKCLSAFGKDGARPQSAILVATQVVEQSLDLDFDSMITALAPIDLLFQRIGRVHRHPGRVRPESMKTPLVIVLTPNGDLKKTLTAKVYSPWILRQTLVYLNGIERLQLPDCIRPLVEQVYSSCPDIHDNDYEDWANLVFNTTLLHETAQPFLYPKPDKRRFFAAECEGFFYEETEDITYKGARTRIGENSIRIAIVPVKTAQRAKHPDKKTAQSILSQVMSVPSELIKGRKEHPNYAPQIAGEGLLSGIIILPSDNQKYAFIKEEKVLWLIIDDELGLITKEE